MLRELAEKVEPRHTALVILDPFTAGGASDTPDDHQLIVPTLNRLISASRAAQMPIVWVFNENRPPWFEFESWRAIPIRVRASRTEFRLLDGLEPKDADFILTKHSYSAFAYSPFDLILRCRNIRTVLLTGGGVLGAVETAAKECFVRGYYVVVARDCVYPASGRHHEIGLRYMALRLGDVATSDEITRCWDVPSAALGS